MVGEISARSRIAEHECIDFEQRPKPLEDELAEALDAVLGALGGAWFSYTRLPGRIEDAEKEARKLTSRAETALTRYKKETADAE